MFLLKLNRFTAPVRLAILTSIGLAGVFLAPVQAGETNHKYDALGRVTQTCYPDGTKINYQYDKAGNRTQVSKVLTGVPSCTGVNNAPVCGNALILLSVPGYAGPVTTSFGEGALRQNCSDVDGHQLSVTSPATPLSVTISAGQTLNYPFTVSDGNGGTATAIFTVQRP